MTRPVARAFAAVLLAYSCVFAWTVTLRADAPPTAAQVAFAQRSSDLMVQTIVAALLQEFAETTPANVEEGKHSISLIFDDRNDSMRLIGDQQPIRDNDVPQDSFEVTALEQAMQGQAHTAVEKVRGQWTYRRSVPLSNFHAACSMCHTNFGPVDTSQWVGALVLTVPVAGQ